MLRDEPMLLQPTTSKPSRATLVVAAILTCVAFGLVLHPDGSEEVFGLVFIPLCFLHLASALRLRAGHPPLLFAEGASCSGQVWVAFMCGSMALLIFSDGRLPRLVVWPTIALGLAAPFLAARAEKQARAQLPPT